MMKRTLFIACAALMCLFSIPTMAQLPTNNTDISPLLIGEQVPDVMLTGTDGKEYSLVSLTKDKPTIIIFYRGKWCSNCIRHFSQEIAPIETQISELGYNMLAICPDVPDTLIKTAQKVNLNPAHFYSDGEGALSKAMGVAVQQQERMLPMLSSYSGGKNKGYLPVPGEFILDTNQKIIFEYINPMSPSDKLRIRGKFLMAVLQALK
jgi:peroxiredoxin